MTKILLVEDDKSLREIYGVRLLAEGYDIVSAGDGEEALAMAIKDRPGLIVSDVMMPKISGFDMLDILRSTTETKDIKVIMMTALSSDDQRERGQQLGADRYLVKSQVGIEDVVRAVHEVLGDAPVAAPQNTFSQPAPSAIPRPAPTTPVPPRPTSQPEATPYQPTSSTPPISEPQPAAAPTVPTSPVPSMPQPTAPFSSERPANLADRVIHPLETPAQPGPDVATLIDNELNGGAPAPNLPVPPTLPPAQPFGAQPDMPPAPNPADSTDSTSHPL